MYMCIPMFLFSSWRVGGLAPGWLGGAGRGCSQVTAWGCRVAYVGCAHGASAPLQVVRYFTSNHQQ